jgi:putative tricarboxylic transport membrane protein
VLRGTALGSILGVLPGGGALLSSFAAYTVEKKMRHGPGEVPFGKGNIRGVAGPESGQQRRRADLVHPDADAGHPAQRGDGADGGRDDDQGHPARPAGDDQQPRAVLGPDRVSMWVGNLMLIILNLPLIGIWIKLLTVPYRFLFPAILSFCCIGLYTLNNNNFDVYMAALFGVVGYVFYKLGCEPAPLLLGFILGPMMEENLRRALLLSRGDWSTFMTRPLSAGLLIAALLMIVVVTLPSIKNKREEAFQDAD